MKFLFTSISLLAVTSLLITFNGSAQGTDDYIQGNSRNPGNSASFPNAGNAASVDEGAAQPAAEVADNAEAIHEEAHEPTRHYHVPTDDNVVDISKFEDQDGVQVQKILLLEGAVKYIFTSTAKTPFTSIMGDNLTVVKFHRDVSYPSVVLVQVAGHEFVMAEAKDVGFLHTQERVAFFKKSAHEWKTAFGREILNHMHRCSKNVTYSIDGDNSEEDFSIDVVDGVTRAVPRPHVFIQSVVYKSQTIFEFSSAVAQTVVGVTVTSQPKKKAELTLLYPLGGFHYNISYEVTDDDRLHSASQASKTISKDSDVCPECDKEATGAAAETSKEENENKESGFIDNAAFVTLVVPLLMMLTLA